jgi:hypothetical protein
MKDQKRKRGQFGDTSLEMSANCLILMVPVERIERKRRLFGRLFPRAPSKRRPDHRDVSAVAVDGNATDFILGIR